jgi:hypothetical protein
MLPLVSRRGPEQSSGQQGLEWRRAPNQGPHSADSRRRLAAHHTTGRVTRPISAIFVSFMKGFARAVDKALPPVAVLSAFSVVVGESHRGHLSWPWKLSED